MLRLRCGSPWLKAQQFSFGWWQGLTAWWLRAFASRSCLGWLRSFAKSAELTIFAYAKRPKGFKGIRRSITPTSPDQKAVGTRAGFPYLNFLVLRYIFTIADAD